jgi:hypothetical protein|uniref:Uncharacterized protein n=1 Tax=uncultured marine virus TaxID=186617 RepID=A0A0F7L4P7_9VIRU|nr:hypothetical protein [uncultured marine virus]
MSYDWFDFCKPPTHKRYRPVLTAVENNKGVLDVDTVKGCAAGTAAYPNGGCYGACYANKIANTYGFDFSVSVSRKLYSRNLYGIFQTIKAHRAGWYRIGTHGDPSHDWGNTVSVCERLSETGKTPVIVTKHWIEASNEQLTRLASVGAVFNTSTSGMDTDAELGFRVEQIDRVRSFGMTSVCRVVSCEYGNTEWADRCRGKQGRLMALVPMIDTPFRVSRNHHRVATGEILITAQKESIGGGSKMVSLNDKKAYLGKCSECPDQCGATTTNSRGKK